MSLSNLIFSVFFGTFMGILIVSSWLNAILKGKDGG